jgi:hypothetical protein
MKIKKKATKKTQSRLELKKIFYKKSIDLRVIKEDKLCY